MNDTVNSLEINREELESTMRQCNLRCLFAFARICGKWEPAVIRRKGRFFSYRSCAEPENVPLPSNVQCFSISRTPQEDIYARN